VTDAVAMTISQRLQQAYGRLADGVSQCFRLRFLDRPSARLVELGLKAKK
jgi:hypothetical protein